MNITASNITATAAEKRAAYYASAEVAAIRAEGRKRVAAARVTPKRRRLTQAEIDAL